MMSAEERAVWLAWEKRTGKCSACGHARRAHNELGYCNSKTSHDRTGVCMCGLRAGPDRKLHLVDAEGKG